METHCIKMFQVDKLRLENEQLRRAIEDNGMTISQSSKKTIAFNNYFLENSTFSQIALKKWEILNFPKFSKISFYLLMPF